MSRRAAMSASVALALMLPVFAGAEEAPDCGTSYTVQQGDTVAAIAKRCGSTIEALSAANPDLKDPSRISIGQELVLPEGKAPEQQSAAGATGKVGEAGADMPADAAPGGAAADDPESAEAVEAGVAEEADHAEEAEPNDAAGPTDDADASEEVQGHGDAAPAGVPEAEESSAAPEEASDAAVTSEPDGEPQADKAEKPTEAEARGEGAGAATEDDAEEEGGADAANAEAEPRLYTVQPGDSMARIANRHGLKLDDLMAANEGVRPRALQPGQELRLPVPEADTQATRGLSRMIGSTETPDDPGDDALEAVAAMEPAPPPLVLEGRIRRGIECPVLRTKDGATYSLVSQDYGFIPGDYVLIEGEAVEMSFCNRGKTVRVTSMRVENGVEPR